MNTFNNLFLVEKSIFDSLLTNSFDIKVFLIILVTTGLLGLLMSICYLFIKRKSGYQPNFPISLIILPMVSSTIIYFVSDNIASGLTLGGIFALTRFRSEQKDTEDLSYIFSTMGIGLICGFGYVTVGIIFALVIITVMILLNVTKFAQPNKKSMRLKIIIPEDLNYDKLFDEILNKYCTSWSLNKVRTAEFGTMFELVYTIYVKKDIDQKAFLDELRTKNGNLDITLVVNRQISSQDAK